MLRACADSARRRLPGLEALLVQSPGSYAVSQLGRPLLCATLATEDALSHTPPISTTEETPTPSRSRSPSSRSAESSPAPPPPSPGSPRLPSPVPASGRVGVVLMQMGGPDSLEAVQPFLRNLFADPDILQLPRPMRPFQPLLARFISARRAPGAREAYASIGGRSPLLPITAQQADALERELLVRGVDAKTYVAMRYWGPRAPEVLNSAARDGVSTLVALPLYPHYSISTSASSIRDLQRALLARSSSASPFRTSLLLPTWQARPGYVAAVARGVARELVACPPDTHVLFSAHGVPEKYVQALGDPYLAEMRECVAAVMRKVRSLAPERAEAPHTLCFQSRVGPVRWLQPYTDATIRELGRRGTRSVLAVPIAFVSEHIETLEEMDGEYAELARRSGVQHWARVAALNDDAGMIADLACAVEEALRGEARSAQDLHAECADEKGDGVASAPELQEEAAAPLVLSDRVHGVPLESAGAARILSSVARVCAQEMERSKGWWSRARIMMS